MRYLIKLIIFVLCTFSISDTINVIDVDDILSEELMPSALLVLENPKNFTKTSNETLNVSNFFQTNIDGSIGNAMETMGFHRSKMNEYLCRSYLAEQIINVMTLTRIKRRMNSGVLQSLNGSQTGSTLKNDLLFDEGSSNYKDWLSKSTTLEDIYRHYNNIDNHIEERTGEEMDKHREINEDYDVDYNFKKQEELEHPNHQQQQQQPKRAPEKMSHSGGGDNAYLHAATGGYPYQHGSISTYGDSGHHSTGYQAGHSGYGGSGNSGGGGGTISHGGHPAYVIHEQQAPIHDHAPKYHIYHQDHSNDSGHDLADLFDIALTALAFLAFKLFLIHVIMCISATKNAATTASMMMPMSMSPTAGSGDNGGGDTGGGDTGGGDTATGGTGGGDTGGGTGGTGGTGGGDTGTGTGTGTGGTATGGTGTATGTATGGTGTGGTATGGTATAGTGNGGTGGTAAATGTTTGGTATGGTGTGTGGARDVIRIRLPRQTQQQTPNYNNQALNELARRVLTTIEAAFLASEDDGTCLRRTLCENNKYSRESEGNNKILIPLWSLGMSWLSGKLATNINPATSMLDTLKASILGLGKANCEIIYQNCNLRQQRQDRRRRRRRRKRQAEN